MPASSHVAAVIGSGERWGPLWGARPVDWALSEDRQGPTYQEALRRVDLKPGQFVLDIGCGVGAFLRLVADCGARAFGLDASEALIKLARSRCRTPICGSVTWSRSPTTMTPSTW